MGAAGGVCSSTRELLLHYGGLVAALKQEIDGTKTDSPVFNGLATLYQGHIAAGQKVETSTQYTLGWVKGCLPGRVGLLSENAGLLEEAPLLGKDTKPQVLFTHTSSLAGFTTTAILLPEMRSAIVVLVNTKASCDSSDFIASAVLEKLVGGTGDHDFVQMARSAMEKPSYRYAEQNAYQITYKTTYPYLNPSHLYFTDRVTNNSSTTKIQHIFSQSHISPASSMDGPNHGEAATTDSVCDTRHYDTRHQPWIAILNKLKGDKAAPTESDDKMETFTDVEAPEMFTYEEGVYYNHSS
ncbi:uncharacterized protein RAG0_16586 [Rhynchosporium agropyri]|uniref:Beta-lactamase-related domain-containing protein n=1 Tax=Rhynchosporium agropyri TaxID=914238 RepID=A0A1E1LR05_9HELO|nr:uncharacterized protein RAG0_16586 [Rhynchosporium agropyri]